jgi:hypothetical protein
MGEKIKKCQYNYEEMSSATLPDARLGIPLRRYWWTLKRMVWYVSILGIREFGSKIVPNTTLGKLFLRRKKTARHTTRENWNFQHGDWVMVRTPKEIFATLDAKGKLRGLSFTQEMTKFCGKKYRVWKKLNKIILEATGELRAIRTPTFLLEGVFCDGTAHGNCDRSCSCFWRAEWLRPAYHDNESGRMSLV